MKPLTNKTPARVLTLSYTNSCTNAIRNNQTTNDGRRTGRHDPPLEGAAAMPLTPHWEPAIKRFMLWAILHGNHSVSQPTNSPHRGSRYDEALT